MQLPDCKTFFCEEEFATIQFEQGTVIIITYIWGFTDSGGQTAPSDISVTLPTDMNGYEAMKLLEEKALAYLRPLGCSELRHYYLERIRNITTKGGTTTFIFDLGT